MIGGKLHRSLDRDSKGQILKNIFTWKKLSFSRRSIRSWRLCIATGSKFSVSLCSLTSVNQEQSSSSKSYSISSDNSWWVFSTNLQQRKEVKQCIPRFRDLPAKSDIPRDRNTALLACSILRANEYDYIIIPIISRKNQLIVAT